MKEIRSASLLAGSEDMTLTGTAIVFGQPTTINTPEGSFTEIIERSALAGADLSDVCLRLEHDGSCVPLARTRSKTLSLDVTDEGLTMRATLACDSPTARDVYAAVQRGDLSGMSFGFVVDGDEWDVRTNTRTIRSIRRVLEISIVAHPCYEGTSVSAETRAQLEAGNRRDEALRMVRRFRAMARIKSFKEKRDYDFQR